MLESWIFTQQQFNHPHQIWEWLSQLTWSDDDTTRGRAGIKRMIHFRYPEQICKQQSMMSGESRFLINQWDNKHSSWCRRLKDVFSLTVSRLPKLDVFKTPWKTRTSYASLWQKQTTVVMSLVFVMLDIIVTPKNGIISSFTLVRKRFF